MDNKKGNTYYINKVITDLEFLITHTKDLTREQFGKDEVLLDSIMFRFIQISEHIKKLSIEFKGSHNNIPWISIIGLRNRIVHEYGNVDLSIVYDAVKEDIYVIHRLFKSIKKE
jgi:uncharacterized protein with HEPN domain